MEVTLVCPIRTLINLNTDVAFSNADVLYELLQKASTVTSQKTGTEFISKKVPPEETAYTKYTNLDFDHRTWASTPLAEVELPDSKLRAIEGYIEDKLEFFSEDIQQIISLKLYIYDNTIAIAVVKLSLSLTQSEVHFHQPSELEQYLTEYAAAIAQHLQVAYFGVFLRALESAGITLDHWKKRFGFIRKPRGFTAFDDLTEHPYPDWYDKRQSLIWAHRIFNLSHVSDRKKAEASELMRVSEFSHDKFYYIKWGTSYMLEMDRIDKFIEMNVSSQYFYSLFDCFGQSQKRLLRRIVDINSRLDMKQISSQFDRQETLISDTINEFLDYLGGLQDINADIFDDIRTSFGTSELVLMLEKRTIMLQERINRIVLRTQLMQQRLVSFVLILLGGTQILGLVLNIWWYAEVKPGDDVFGFLDLAQVVRPDVALNFTFVSLIVIAALWVIASKRTK